MKRGSIFETDGIPRIQEALPLALQHVVAMIVGCVTPAIIVAGAAGLENKDQVILIQAALVVAALSTLLQLFPLGRSTGLVQDFPSLWVSASHMYQVCRPLRTGTESTPFWEPRL